MPFGNYAERPAICELADDRENGRAEGCVILSHAALVACFFEDDQPRPWRPNFATLAAVSRHVAKKPQDAAIVADRIYARQILHMRGRITGTTVVTSIFRVGLSLERVNR